MKKARIFAVSTAIISLASFLAISNSYTADGSHADNRQWLAGDHHIHSRYSVGWDNKTEPPSPVLGGDAIYPITMNAVMGRRHGLDWMVSTDHGGPNHSKVNRDYAYPELLEARKAVPDMVIFYGMEFDTPGADHSSIIVPHSDHEADDLYQIESRFAKREPWPANADRDTEDRMLQALTAMSELSLSPVVIAHHPSRSAAEKGEFGLTSPAELRAWNDTAPHIAVGMEGAPGHQAVYFSQPALGVVEEEEDVFSGAYAGRGAYGRFPTMGGFDQMTAQVGGFWDSMLSEGRRWWITANSDSHVHWSEGGVDFWPGEYSKTYILAERNHASILESLREGRVFVTTGDLVSELWVSASSGTHQTDIGGTLTLDSPQDVTVTIKFLHTKQANANGDIPEVNRVDLIVGEVTGPVTELDTASTNRTHVETRFTASDWRIEGDYQVMDYTLRDVDAPVYLRVRGTNTQELEPELDVGRENPWRDLWFYSNPIFIEGTFSTP
jgi:hypothetical protein